MYIDIYLGSFYSIKFLYDFFKTFLKSVVPPYASSSTLPHLTMEWSSYHTIYHFADLYRFSK